MRLFRFLYDISGGSLSIAKPFTKEIRRWEAAMEVTIDGVPVRSDISIWDRKEDLSGIAVHRGLMAQVDIPGEDILSASEDAGARLHSLLSAATLQSGATVAEIRMEFGYETTSGVEQTEFVQAHYLDRGVLDPDVLRVKRRIDATKFEDLIRRRFQLSEPRVTRAIIWYRTALMQTDAINKLVSYWTGLENLNKPLMALLGETPEVRYCKQCKAPYEDPTNKGVRSLFDKHSPGGLKNFTDCRDLRVALLHGTETMGEANTRAAACAEICSRLLRIGVYLLLGLTADDSDKDPEPFHDDGRLYLQFQGHYGVPPDQLPNNPKLIVQGIRVKVNDKDGERRIGVEPTIAPDVPAPVQCSVTLFGRGGEYAKLDDFVSPGRSA